MLETLGSWSRERAGSRACAKKRGLEVNQNYLEELKGSTFLQLLKNDFQMSEAASCLFHVILKRLPREQLPSIGKVFLEWKERLQQIQVLSDCSVWASLQYRIAAAVNNIGEPCNRIELR